METPLSERRQYERINLLAYGQGKKCTLDLGGRSHQAVLIDISAGGARVKLLAHLGPDTKGLVFSVNEVQDQGLLQRLDASVRWQNGLELGLQFSQQLDVAVSTLQRIVC